MPSDIGPFNGGSVPPFDFFVLGLNGIIVADFVTSFKNLVQLAEQAAIEKYAEKEYELIKDWEPNTN